MNDLASAKASFSDQAVIFKRKHNWIMCWLYLGTFGSFIGYSAGFPLLIKSQFPQINALSYAWLGPLVGALIRPLGGWLSDKLGGARVTFWNFVAMVVGVLGVLYFLPQGGQGGNFYGFLAMFMVLFAAAGIGNGSTFRMIPVIFMNERQREAAGKGRRPRSRRCAMPTRRRRPCLVSPRRWRPTAASSFPMSYGISIAHVRRAEPTRCICSSSFYVTCIAMTWWYYARRNAPMPC